MSSKIHVKRLCEYCENEFIACTTVTRFCNSPCNKKAYKKKLREDKIVASNLETEYRQVQERQANLDRPVMTVKQIADGLGIYLKAACRLINAGKLDASNFSIRMTWITREIVQQFFEDFKISPKNVSYKVPEKMSSEMVQEQLVMTPGNCYTVPEISEMFQMDRWSLYDLLKRKGIPKVKIKKDTIT